ncbi:MAG TPA: heparinase II/III family protein [Blastocatellia bacterium]|nr:heparinase II/III family protein [Blastocatellia bacterium]
MINHRLEGLAKNGIVGAIAVGAILLLVGIASHGPAAGQQQAKVVHPRLLIGERDPYTGFAALRARYAKGLRPADDIAGWALTYLLTGDEAFARRATNEMRRTRPPEKVGSRTYMDYVRWSLAFDWLYNYPDFDEPLKNRIAGELLDGAERMFADHALAEPSLVMYHNYSVRYLALASFALAAIEGCASVEQRAAPLRERARRSLDNVLDISQFITPEGGYHESMDYARITFLPMALLAELRRTTTGDDPARRFTSFGHYSDTYLYKVLPNGTTARDDDQEWPYFLAQDNDVLGYIINRFKDPYAAWMLRESGWASTKKWYIPILEFLWDDPEVRPRDPALASEAELPRQHHFSGIGDLVMRDGWGKGSTWIAFNAGPYVAKHQHLDQNQFTIYHNGYLAIDSGADYTDIESPHYLNYYRRSVAHNTMLVYQPGEHFFWAENLWPAANDGGQRMDSSRYWNTIRSREDWKKTRDLWDLARMEATDYQPGEFQYARGNATRAYNPSKLQRFTRELLYTPRDNVLVVFDRVRSTDPAYKKVWLLHGVNEPRVATIEPGKDVGHGGTAYRDAREFTFEEGGGRLRVHALLPREREVVKRGGAGWEFWSPGDESGGPWGSGRNWPLEPWEGGPLPADPFLKKMWQTFYGQAFTQLLKSNQRDVVPGSWRIEVSPAVAAKEDLFLHVLEIGDKGDGRAPRVELVEGSNLVGAMVEDGAITLFATTDQPVTEAEATIPNVQARTLLITGLRPDAKYELQLTGGRTSTWGGGLFQGVHRWSFTGDADNAGVLRVPFDGQRDGRLRLRALD